MQIEDGKVVRMLQYVCNNIQDTEKVYGESAKQLGEDLKWAARKFHLQHPRLTPYGLRRGGATHHFLEQESYDRTAELGRWAQVKTARLYIEGAAAELGEWSIDSKGTALMTELHEVLKHWVSALKNKCLFQAPGYSA